MARRLVPTAPWVGNNCRAPQQGSKPPPVPWSGEIADFFHDYRALDDIHRFLALLAREHPDLVTMKDLGHSWEGRPLRALEITSATTPKPLIFLEGGIHSREWIASSTVLYIAGAMLRDRALPEVKALLDNFIFTLLVPVNPDGYVYSWKVDRLWRKTRSNRSEFLCEGKVAGVDANRNWGVTFGQTTNAAYEERLHDPCSQVFIGPAPFSEPETKAASEYMKQRQTAGGSYVAAFIDYHSFAEAMLPPWAYTAETPQGPDGVYQTAMTSYINEAFFNTSGRTFHAGADVFPPDPGTGPDWAYGLLGIRATMTIELEGHSFCLPAQQIENVGREQWAGVKALAHFLEKHGGEPSKAIGMFAAGDTSLAAETPHTLASTASYGWMLPLALVVVLSLGLVGLVARARSRVEKRSFESSEDLE